MVFSSQAAAMTDAEWAVGAPRVGMLEHGLRQSGLGGKFKKMAKFAVWLNCS